MTDEVDEAVLRRFVDGDRDAFEAVYRQHHREVYGWILRIVRNPAAADDALVDAFWRAYRSRARFDASRSFGAWMRRIATNAAIDQLRRNPLPIDLAAQPEPEAPPQPDVDVQRHITSALRSLPPRLRIVAVLALVEERPLAEIADALDVPVGTVKSRLFRATRALRATLARLGIQP